MNLKIVVIKIVVREISNLVCNLVRWLISDIVVLGLMWLCLLCGLSCLRRLVVCIEVMFELSWLSFGVILIRCC